MSEQMISVIVPIYNVEEYLEKCIDSIICQSYKNLEIILIDDGSTDNCGEICEKYKKKDKRIVVFHKSNEGLSSARNYGLNVAKGTFISFIDSDDYIEPTMIEELKNNMDKYNSDISICDYYKEKNKIKNRIHNNFINQEFVLYNKEKFNYIHNEYGYLSSVAWNKLYKKKIFDNIRYPKYKIYEDSYVICDILEKANSVSYILKPLYNHVYRKNSIVNTFNINQFNKIDSSNKKISFFYSNGYYDLVRKEKKKKINELIINLVRMKKYKIKNKKVYKKYYKELVNTNKEVKWKDSTKYIRFYKVFRKPSICIFALGLRIKDLVNK